jgi:hypothetical protein
LIISLPPVFLLPNQAHPIRIQPTCCGIPLSKHLRCRACTVLVGSGHVYGGVNADGLCEDCAASFVSVRRDESSEGD